MDLLPGDDSKLKKHFSPDRCFFVGLPRDGKSCLDPLSELEKCIASVAKDDRWTESMPKEWSIIEFMILETKNNRKNDIFGERIILVEELETKIWSDTEDVHVHVQDALRFFNDIGFVLYFNEKELSESFVIDVQWVFLFFQVHFIRQETGPIFCRN